MREHLGKNSYTQIPQLSSMNPIDVNSKFDLVPDTATGTRRAVMIGINYVGEWYDTIHAVVYAPIIISLCGVCQ